MTSIAETRKALVKASVDSPGRFVPVFEIQSYAPHLSISELGANLGGMHDTGSVTTNGSGAFLKARFEGLIWRMRDGTFGTVIKNGYVMYDIETVIEEGYVAEPCS